MHVILSVGINLLILAPVLAMFGLLSPGGRWWRRGCAWAFGIALVLGLTLLIVWAA